MRGEQRESADTEEWRSWWRERGERELRIILMTAWDPIGVGDSPEAWGEYDGYALQVAHALHESAGPDTAAPELRAISTTP